MTEVAYPRSAAAARPLRALVDKLRDLWLARELLRQFVGKELKVRYKQSFLGVLWSFITPAAMTLVFTVVFAFIIRINVEDFAAFFISGYLVWQFFQNSVGGSIDSIVGNGNLVKKVYFPREVLPLSIVLSQFVHLLLAMLVVAPYVFWVRGAGVATHLPVLVIGLILLGIFTSGVSMLLAGANVFFRDLRELMGVLFMVWFYATPVIYPTAMVERALEQNVSVAETFQWVQAANPMTWYVGWVRGALYGEIELVNGAYVPTSQVWPDPLTITMAVGWALGAFIIGYAAFLRFARNFAKEV